MVDNNHNEEIQRAQEQINKNTQVLCNAAKTIYESMPPGTTMRFELIEQPTIMLRGTKPKKSILIVTRPFVDMVIQAKLNVK